MPQIRVRVLGPATLEVDGYPVSLTPSSARILALLVAADGAAVPIGRLHREVWPDSMDRSHRRPHSRTDVQKRISALRRAMDPARSGPPASPLRTETVISGRETESAYRLVLGPDSLDCAEFEQLVREALSAAPPVATDRLTRALDLWRGSPLAEAGDADFSLARIRRLHALRATARRELVAGQVVLGRLDLALSLAERIAAEHPDDLEATEQAAAIRAALRGRRGDEILRYDWTSPRCTIVAVRGDLFGQDDANLVVGFTDTFDTSTNRNEQISVHSVQGQLLHKLFDGDTGALDRELRRGLRAVAPSGRETARDKPKGKRVRYPIGTVVPLTRGGRVIFAVAYSEQSNDLLGRSSPAELRDSLTRLWTAVGRRGQLRPVAIPLVGSKLARINEHFQSSVF